MAFIDIDFLTGLGFEIPQSSVDQVETKLNQLIEDGERVYLQNTIGYSLTTDIYALPEPYPSEVDIFLNGNLVDGDEFYRGVLVEIASFIMADYYGNLSLDVNNSGFSMPIADGEKEIEGNFIAADLISYAHNLRCRTYQWLKDNNVDFFEDWNEDMFKQMFKSSVW